jgi:CRISPR-associated exonuclease Cas4
METVLVSALEHWSYCPRQCGLIHVENVWDENLFTVRGEIAHERVDQVTSRSERGKRIERALPIWSDRHGLQGRADVVEFVAKGRPYPVEYKSGKRRPDHHSAIQLCAQALCLEEMFGISVPEGAIFFVTSKTREPVMIDDNLRSETFRTIEAVRDMISNQNLPSAKYDRRCRDCSLIDACLPQTLGRIGARRAAELFIPLTEVDLP